MTATAIVEVNQQLQQQRSQLTRLIQQVNGSHDEGELKEVRARINAARAWARAHKQLKEVRFDLLVVEIRALVRAWELGADSLTASEALAAEAYATMGEPEIVAMIRRFGSATTAAGLWRASQRRKGEETRYRDEVESWRSSFTSDAPRPHNPSPDRYHRLAADYVQGVYSLLARVLDEAGELEQFTIEGITNTIVGDLGDPDWASDPALVEGLKEVSRAAVRSSYIETWHGTKIPRFITAVLATDSAQQFGDNVEYVRIPTMQAKLRDLDSMVALREEQLRQDRAAYARLVDFRDQLKEEPGVHADSNIGQIIERSVMGAKGEAA